MVVGGVARSGPGGPRPGEQRLGHAVELAEVAEGERAQERPQRGRRHDPMAQHAGGLPAAQQVGVVDTVPTRQHRVDQGQQLAPGPVRTSPLAQIDHLIGGLLDAQPLGQRGRQQQTGVGDGVSVVKAGVELIQDVGGSHRERALLIRGYGSSRGRHASRSEGLSQTQDQQHSMTTTLHRGYDPRRWW